MSAAGLRRGDRRRLRRRAGVVLDGPEGRHAATVTPAAPSARRSCSSTAAAARAAGVVAAVSGRTAWRSTSTAVDRRARAGAAAGRRAGAAQGRPRRAGGRDDDRGGRRRDRAVGGGAVRDPVARRARREGAGTMAYDGAGGRQAVPPRRGSRRSPSWPHRATWPTGCAAAAAGVRPARGAPSALVGGRRCRPPARSWSSSAPRAGSAPRSWPSFTGAGRHGVPAGTDRAAHVDRRHRRGGRPAVPHPALALTCATSTVNVLVSTCIAVSRPRPRPRRPASRRSRGRARRCPRTRRTRPLPRPAWCPRRP